MPTLSTTSDREIFGLAIPALGALAADPLITLPDLRGESLLVVGLLSTTFRYPQARPVKPTPSALRQKARC